MKEKQDYHDYVFKDGRLVGEFDEMYKHADGVPWHQDTVPNTWHGRIGTSVIEAAFDEGPIESILEVGCGYGHILSKLNVGPNVRAAGFDISPTAIERARELHPDHSFFVDELVALNHEGSYDLVICREVLWYVVDDLDRAIQNLARLTRPNKFAYVGLSFPCLTENYVGKQVLPDPNALVAKLGQYFDTVVDNRLLKMKFPKDGPNFHWLGQKKVNSN